MAVIPRRPGLEGEGQLGKALCKLRVVQLVIENIGVHVRRLHQHVAEEAVGETGRVAQQVLNRHLPLRVDQFELRLAVFALAFNADFHVFECRDVLRNRILEHDLALLEHHHDRDRGDRLGHGVDAEDRILGHRRLGFGIEHADGLEIRNLAVTHDHRDSARDGALRAFGAQPLGDAVEPLGRQPDVRRPGGRQVLRREVCEKRKNDNERESQGFECTHVAPPILVRFSVARERTPIWMR